MTAPTKLNTIELEEWQFPAEMEAFFDEEDEEALYYYYDDENHWLELRHKRGDMPGADHSDVVDYIMQVLFWFYRVQQYAIYRELNFYQTANQLEKPLYPDVALLKSQKRSNLKSYRLGVDGPPPELIVEFISTKTRASDLKRKPQRYDKWGVDEYFAHDPRPRKRKSDQPRLWGWRRTQTGRFEEIMAEADGRMWSIQLDCWLVPEGQKLRLYTREGKMLLTEAEAEHRRAERFAEQLRQAGIEPDPSVE